jgi:ABC-type amino acid transport substrate-binding protein
MTTVGYGDKAPKTTGGRVVGLIWMFASIIIVSSFTAGIASSLTASQVASNQLRSKPLGSLIIATVEGSTGEDYARKSGLRCSTYPGLEEALEAIQKGEAEAIIYDLPLLKYRLMQQPDLRLEIMPKTLVQESYAIALPPGSARRETLNRALLSVIGSPEWQVLRTEYLGYE